MSYWNTGYLGLAVFGDGELNVLNGASVEGAFLYLTEEPEVTATVTVGGSAPDGTYSLVDFTTVDIGYEGVGILNVVDGGQIDTTSLVLAERTTGSGTLNVGLGGVAGTVLASMTTFGSGRSTINFNHTGDISFDSDIRQNGGVAATINVIQGRTLLTGGLSNHSATVNIQGGTLAFETANAVGTGQINMSGGTLTSTRNETLTHSLLDVQAGSSTISAVAGRALALDSSSVALRDGAELHFGTATDTGTVILLPSFVLQDPGEIDVFLDYGTVRFGSVAANRFFYTPFATVDLSATIAAGATLDVNGYMASFNGLSGTGTVLNGAASTVDVFLGSGTYSTAFRESSTGGDMSVFVTGSGLTTLTADSDFSGRLTVENGTLRLEGDLSTDDVRVSDGTLEMAGGDFTGAPVVEQSANGIFDITSSGGTVSVGGLTTTATAGNSAEVRLGNDLRIVGTPADGTYGTTAMISGTGSVYVNNGQGVQVFAAANTYMGDTRIQDGTLALTNSEGLGASGHGTYVEQGGTLDLRNGIYVISEPLTLGGGSYASDNLATLRSSDSVANYGGDLSQTLAGSAGQPESGHTYAAREANCWKPVFPFATI
ncbi:MAG: autotransporter-associated beta strand repeat-containing protein [Pseudomonadota bacterium]|nr:autotransporter-associated beta strand repeat-containing protein [Pseudomonadota bacterium]